MSIYFDFVKFLLLLEYSTADLLSQNNVSGLSISSIISNLVTKYRNNIPWLDASWHVINFAIMVKEAMSVCLALF